jgi:hypothetical protein
MCYPLSSLSGWFWDKQNLFCLNLYPWIEAFLCVVGRWHDFFMLITDSGPVGRRRVSFRTGKAAWNQRL